MNRKQFVLPALVLGAAAFAYAQANTPTKVGIINIQAAIVGTKEGQKAASEIEAKRAPKAKQLQGQQEEIKSLQEKLSKGSNTMAETARQGLMRDIDQKTKAFNRDLEDAQMEWDQEQQKVLQELGGKMMAVINKYASDHGYTLILDISSPQTPVLYAANSIEITKDIIDLYDKNAPGAATTPSASPAPATTTPPPTPPAAAKPKPGAPK
ncbi:MAG TPA: OmpH family outer membrane protein [Bryobacteraceae bacterium]|nr:OmpH family outer membrane protein [Bryobacteraceae bacterium]